MRKFKLLAVFVLAIALVPASALAAEIKIAYVNLDKAIKTCEACKKAMEDLDVEYKRLQELLEPNLQELKKLKEEIDEKGAMWNQETRESKEKDLKTKSQKYQQKYMEFGEEFNKKKEAAEFRIIKEIREVVEELAEKKNYTFVFERAMGGILYAPKEADITDEVLKAYDKKFLEKGEK